MIRKIKKHTFLSNLDLNIIKILHNVSMWYKFDLIKRKI